MFRSPSKFTMGDQLSSYKSLRPKELHCVSWHTAGKHCFGLFSVANNTVPHTRWGMRKRICWPSCCLRHNSTENDLANDRVCRRVCLCLSLSSNEATSAHTLVSTPMAFASPKFPYGGAGGRVKTMFKSKQVFKIDLKSGYWAAQTYVLEIRVNKRQK